MGFILEPGQMPSFSHIWEFSEREGEGQAPEVFEEQQQAMESQVHIIDRYSAIGIWELNMPENF